MAVSINGVSKKVSSSDTGTLQGVDSSSLLVEMDKEYKKLLKTLTEKTAESTKVTDELGYKIDAAYDILSKRSKEVSILTKRAEKTFNNLKNLSEEQQKVVLSSLKEDIASAFQSFEDVPKDLAEITNSLGKIKGSTDLRRTFEEISAISKKVQRIADQNQKAQERNLRISDSRKELLGSVEKWGTRTRDSLIESSFSMLGPLSPFLSSLYRTIGDNRDAFRRKKVLAPTEAALRKDGSPAAMGSILVANTIKKTSGGSLFGGSSETGGIVDSVISGAAEGLVERLIGTSAGYGGLSLSSGITSKLSSKGILGAAKLGLSGLVMGVILYDLVDSMDEWAAVASGAFQKQINDLQAYINSAPASAFDTDSNGVTSGGEINNYTLSTMTMNGEDWKGVNILPKQYGQNALLTRANEGFEKGGFFGTLEGLMYSTLGAVNNVTGGVSGAIWGSFALQSEMKKELESKLSDSYKNNVDELGLFYQMLIDRGYYEFADNFLYNLVYGNKDFQHKVFGGNMDPTHAFGIDFYNDWDELSRREFRSLLGDDNTYRTRTGNS